MKNLSKNLCHEWRAMKLAERPSVSKQVWKGITNSIATVEELEKNKKGKRSMYIYFPSSKKRMSVYYCAKCNKTLYGTNIDLQIAINMISERKPEVIFMYKPKCKRYFNFFFCFYEIRKMWIKFFYFKKFFKLFQMTSLKKKYLKCWF